MHEESVTWLRSLGVDDADEVADALEACAKDAERIDAIEHLLFEHKWNGVIDSGSRTHWNLVGNWRHVVQGMEGKDFRTAIDAIKEKK